MLEAAISALGLQIAFYYGLAALAVVLAYRRVLFRSVSNLVFIGLWPLLGAVFMFWVFVESLPSWTRRPRSSVSGRWPSA